MKTRWYVIDALLNGVSWADEAEVPEYFESRAAAIDRACELALEEPQTRFLVCEVTDIIVAEVKLPQVTQPLN